MSQASWTVRAATGSPCWPRISWPTGRSSMPRLTRFTGCWNGVVSRPRVARPSPEALEPTRRNPHCPPTAPPSRRVGTLMPRPARGVDDELELRGLSLLTNRVAGKNRRKAALCRQRELIGREESAGFLDPCDDVVGRLDAIGLG